MKQLNLDYLKKRYPQRKWTGNIYNELMKQILAHNSEKISNQIFKITDDNFSNELRKITQKEKRIVLPDVTDVLPKKSVFISKAAEKGNLITENLRNKLTNDLRNILEKPEYIVKRGELAGTLKKQALDEFRESIKQTFENYTKRNPVYGIPSNIEMITRTELRGVVEPTKNEYMGQMLKKNHDIKIIKIWKHNARFSKHAREAHRNLDGKKIDYNKDFIIKHKNGTSTKTPYPHHYELPPSETISCSCEVIYMVIKI